MRKTLVAGICAATVGLAGCENMTTQEQMVVGGLTGAAAGLLTADAFDANRNWTIMSALAGAAVGTLVATNAATQECAYAVGDGLYRIAPCP